MDWYKRNPFFYSVLAVLVAVAICGLWFLSGERKELSELISEHDRKSRVLESLLSRKPSPTNGNIEVLDLNYATLYQEYKRSLGVLKLDAYDKDLFFGVLPATHNDAFFAIARYVEDTRVLASGKGVGIPEGYRFGFEEYANTGPEQSEIENCHHQMKIMGVLAQWLLDSGISELLGIQRGRDSSEGVVSSRRESDAEFAADVYAIDRDSKAKMDGAIESKSFRVAFKGQSASLRNFLNRLTNSSLPLVVSSIETRLSGETGKDGREAMPENPFFQDASEEAMEASRIPIISENESLFVVTLEFLTLVEEFVDPIVFANAERSNDV